MRSSFLFLTFSDFFLYTFLPVIVHRTHEYLYHGRLVLCEFCHSRKDRVDRVSFELLVGTDRVLLSFFEFHDLASYDASSLEDIHLVRLFDESIWIETEDLFLDEEFGSLWRYDVEVDLLLMGDILE